VWLCCWGVEGGDVWGRSSGAERSSGAGGGIEAVQLTRRRSLAADTINILSFSCTGKSGRQGLVFS